MKNITSLTKTLLVLATVTPLVACSPGFEASKSSCSTGSCANGPLDNGGGGGG